MVSRRNFTKLAYHTLQQGKSIAGLAHKELSSRLMEFIDPDGTPIKFPISNELFSKLRRSMSNLEKIDWEESEQGLYPKSQLFDAPWMHWAASYPLVWLDMPSTWRRRKTRKTRDLPKEINPNLYPKYYLQNFHHQTDGYLSEYSASLYDIQVEILFNGTADAMRRRIIKPLKDGLKKSKESNKKEETPIRILDVATGTGRTLQQIRSAFPDAELFGLDLSGSYLKQASRYLNSREGDLVQLIKGNAEAVPMKSNSLNAVTCVFLLHELPREARQNVISECFRLIEPGGTFVLADSIQRQDSPDFITVMENFHKNFHEPFYNDYINDDINLRLESSGFKVLDASTYFMTRVWTAKKPNET